MKIGKRTFVITAVFIMACVAAWIASAFYGLPWKEKAIAAKLEGYLEKRYEQDFVLKESFYNFKDGTYGAWFYPASDPDLEFYADEGFADYTYVDSYPEVLWARQLKEAIQPIAKELYPAASVDTSYVSYESLDIVKGPGIPTFDEAVAMLGVHLEIDEPFSESDEEWERVAELVEKVQALSPVIDTSFRFIDKKEGIETFITCPVRNEAEIRFVDDARKSCMISRYDMDSSTLLEK